MLKLIVHGRSLDESTRRIIDLPVGKSVAELLRDHRALEWTEGQDIIALIGSREVGSDVVPAEGDFVSLTPRIGGAGAVFAVISLLGTVYGYARSKQQLKAQQQAKERREDRTYQWDTPNLTAYGEGFRVGVVLGEHRVGGAVISTRLEQSDLYRLGSDLTLLVALSEGPVESIGGLTLEPHGERDYLTTYIGGDIRFPFNSSEFPAGLRINGFDADPASVSVSLRKGRLNQSPIPDWPGAATNISVAGPNLTTTGEFTAYSTGDADIWSVHAELYFPDGLWREDSSGRVQRWPVAVEMAFRKVGTVPWIPRQVTYEADPPLVNPFSLFLSFATFPVNDGPFEVRVTRLDDTTAPDRHSTFSLRSIQVRYGEGFSYPGVALMSIRLPATESLQGSVTDVSVPVRGVKVRGWLNSTFGWTAYAWNSVIPWVFPIGRNPAWLFVHVCLAKWGLGRYIRESNLDLDAFRDWADFCDTPHPRDNTKAMLCFDGVLDEGEDAIEVLVRIAAAGRAIPILSGSRKLSVKFAYRDAIQRGFGQGWQNDVPARIATGVISTSCVDEFEVEYTDPATTPVILDAQILTDEGSNYDHRVISLEDNERFLTTDGSTPDPVTRRELFSMFGVTRPLQARYELQLQHNFNRLSRTRATVRAGIEALQYQIGEIVILQHDSMLIAGFIINSARTTSTGTISSIVLDKPVTLVGAARTGTGLWIQDANGVVRECTIDQGAGLVLAGTPLPLWDPILGAVASITVQRGAPIVLGPYLTTRRLYEVVGITTTPECRRVLTLVEWDPAMFDVPAALDVTEGDGVLAPVPTQELSVLVDAQGTTAAAGQFRASHSVSWSSLDPGMSRTTRAYVKTRDGRYSLLGETTSDSLTGLSLHPGGLYELAVVRDDGQGRFPLFGNVARTTFSAPEFGLSRPADIARLTARVDADGIFLDWPHIDDQLHYEVRRGGAWYGSEVIGITRDNRWHIPRPSVGSGTYRVKLRGVSGLYGPSSPTAVAIFALPNVKTQTTTLAADLTGGAAVSLTWDATALAAKITGSALRGTFTPDEIDLGEDLLVYWSACVNSWAVDANDFSSFTLGQPAGFWASCGGREPTKLYPGYDFDAGTATIPITYADPELEKALAGQWSRVLLETRYYAGGAWGAWERHTPGRRIAQMMQARVTLDRYATDITVYVNGLTCTAGWW